MDEEDGGRVVMGEAGCVGGVREGVMFLLEATEEVLVEATRVSGRTRPSVAASSHNCSAISGCILLYSLRLYKRKYMHGQIRFFQVITFGRLIFIKY